MFFVAWKEKTISSVGWRQMFDLVSTREEAIQYFTDICVQSEDYQSYEQAWGEVMEYNPSPIEEGDYRYYQNKYD